MPTISWPPKHTCYTAIPRGVFSIISPPLPVPCAPLSCVQSPQTPDQGLLMSLSLVQSTAATDVAPGLDFRRRENRGPAGGGTPFLCTMRLFSKVTWNQNSIRGRVFHHENLKHIQRWTLTQQTPHTITWGGCAPRMHDALTAPGGRSENSLVPSNVQTVFRFPLRQEIFCAHFF